MKHDHTLVAQAKELLRREAALDLELIGVLRDIYKEKIHLAYGSPSFHAFCTQVLGMSDDSAWRRMKAASLADRFPEVVKPLIAEGKVHLTGLALLDKVITPENGERLLTEAAGKSTTEIKAIIAREAPEECTPGVRKLSSKPQQVAQSTWKFQATMDAATREVLSDVQDMADEDDCNVILREALAAYREALAVKHRKALKRPAKQANADAARKANDAASMRPSKPPTSRDVPRWMEREVRERDGHRCTFLGHYGRCTARRHLQVHHIKAVALGGPTELGNLTLHCGLHNRYQAELDLGPDVANAWRHSRRETLWVGGARTRLT